VQAGWSSADRSPPYYQASDAGHAKAREAMGFSSTQAQALMYAASLLTDRSGNFDSMTVRRIGLQPSACAR
jgi:hypothetical protein